MPAASRASNLSAAAVPVASIGANVFSYALLLAAAHLLSKSAYGQLSSLLGLLLIATVPMFALQTVAARRIATGTGAAGLARGSIEIGGGAAALLVVAAPAISWFLHLRSVVGPLAVAGCVPAMATLGTAQGVAQGGRRFHRLALLIVAAIGGRSVGGLIGLLIGRGPLATLVGVLVGTNAAATAVLLAGWVGWPSGYSTAWARTRPARGVVVETLHAAHAHGSFLLLTSLDVLLARHVLTSDDAGLYAAGSVITRASLWLPQSVVLLMFASLAEEGRHHATARKAGVAVAALGAAVVAGTAVLGGLVVTVVGGEKYRDLESIAWLFALLGALLALVQLAIMAGLALRRTARTMLLWLTAAADVGVVLAMGDDTTPAQLVTALVVVTGCGAAVAAALVIRRPDVAQLDDAAGHVPAV